MASLQEIQNAISNKLIGSVDDLKKRFNLSDRDLEDLIVNGLDVAGLFAGGVIPEKLVTKGVEAGTEIAAKVSRDAAGNIIKNEAAEKILFKKAEDIAGEQTAKKLQNRFGITYERAVKLVKSEKLKLAVRDVASSKFTWAISAGTIVSAGFAVTGFDVLTNWAALDNVIGQQSILIRDITQATIRGDLDPERAKELIDESESLINTAETKINTSLEWNPFMIMSKRLWNAGIQSAKDSLAANKQLIDQKVAEQQAATETGSNTFTNPVSGETTTYDTPEEALRQQQSYESAEYKQSLIAKEKAAAEEKKRQQREAELRNKDSASRGPGALEYARKKPLKNQKSDVRGIL